MKYLPLTALAFLIFITGCVSGTHKVTGMLHEPVGPDAVMIYSVMPAHAEVIGLISADSFAGISLKDASAGAIHELKTQAGRMGANGVVLNAPDNKSGQGVQMQAQAVFVTQ